MQDIHYLSGRRLGLRLCDRRVPVTSGPCRGGADIRSSGGNWIPLPDLPVFRRRKGDKGRTPTWIAGATGTTSDRRGSGQSRLMGQTLQGGQRHRPPVDAFISDWGFYPAFTGSSTETALDLQPGPILPMARTMSVYSDAYGTEAVVKNGWGLSDVFLLGDS